MNQKKIIVAAILLIASSGGLHAQEAVPAAGNEASGAGGTCSYTIGQIAYTSNSGANGEVNQGVQQPYEILTTAGIEDHTITLELAAFPNPTNGLITISVSEYSQEKLSYQLFDTRGKLLEEKEITQPETGISMDRLTPAAYLLKITDNGQLVKEFQIIKN
ncbi:T9SS type A sorting domain-containing protein [Fluviicola chungangensis]|uniref:T9SS type A sorting domain-containing protein n=1 Tax=Fluviicola chungangensis TaxID=2597671 RepID=A0A556MYQ1_9FLAO|nr:T9SS type A sorting domain-containing protein [Fluviicola chungangensis]TSJ44973.1 T9SS type A sorting domain-containing protein [Fluviicola chungangensis]